MLYVNLVNILVIITDARNEGAQNAMNAAIEYVSNNNLTMVNSSTFIKMGKTPKETVQKGVYPLYLFEQSPLEFFPLFFCSLEQLFTLDGQMLMLVCSFDINIRELEVFSWMARVLNDVTSTFFNFQLI